MANYQRYQQYKKQPEKTGFRFGRMVVIFGVLFVLYLIIRSLFGGGADDPTLVDENGVAIAGTQTNTNTPTSEDTGEDADTNSNINADTNSNVNTNTAVREVSDVDTTTCSSSFSRGATDEKRVSFTFNVGTSKEGEIQKVLAALNSAGVSADFFARGDVAENNPNLISQISSAGFHVYNLSYQHPRFTELTEDEMLEQLQKADDAISTTTGVSTKPFFRPPYGAVDDDVVATVAKAGYCTVAWTVDALDWSTDYTATDSQQRVLDNVSNGAIILMQASNATTAEIVPTLLSELGTRGYQIVNLQTLLGL